MNWRNLTFDAGGTSPEWRWRIGNGPVLSGIAALELVVSKWQATTPLLVAPPGSQSFLPVLEVERLAPLALASARRIQLRGVLAVTAAFLVCAASSVFDRGGRLGSPAFLFSLSGVGAYLLSEYLLVVRDVKSLTERARFFVWVHERARSDFFAWLAFVLILGLGQYGLQNAFAGRDGLLLEWGMPYSAVLDGEWWRVLSGPLLHTNVGHWSANGVMLVIVAAVMSSLCRRAVFISFVVGNSAGALCAMATDVFIGTHAVGYAGMSAGVAAIIGWGIGFSTRQPSLVPSKFVYSLLGFAFVNLLISWLMSPNSSNAGHLAGLAAGALLGYAAPWKARE